MRGIQSLPTKKQDPLDLQEIPPSRAEPLPFRLLVCADNRDSIGDSPPESISVLLVVQNSRD